MTRIHDNRPLAEDDDVEQSDDLTIKVNQAQQVVVWPSDWTTGSIIGQIEKGVIDLNPNFQRRSVWKDTEKSRFVESLILGIPIPQLIIAASLERNGPYIVIDGKQRLTAIQHFAANKLKLQRLKWLKKLNGKYFSDLDKDDNLREYVSGFENSRIRTVVMESWKTDDILHETFLRINTGSVKLSPQELRQALYPGKFSDFVFTESEKSEELKLVLNTDGPDPRMRDAELLLRYISYKNFIGDYRGNLKEFLDKTTKILNEDWDLHKAKIENQVEQMEEAFAFTRYIFKFDYMCKSDGLGTYEKRRNKAVIDIMLHYFSCASVRNSLKSRAKDVKKEFDKLCGDEKFRSSFELSTKNNESNRARFNIWGDALEKMTKMDLSHMKFPMKISRKK